MGRDMDSTSRLMGMTPILFSCTPDIKDLPTEKSAAAARRGKKELISLLF